MWAKAWEKVCVVRGEGGGGRIGVEIAMGGGIDQEVWEKEWERVWE